MSLSVQRTPLGASKAISPSDGAAPVEDASAFPCLTPDEQKLLYEELGELHCLLQPFMRRLPGGIALESIELVGGDAAYLLYKIGYLRRVFPGFREIKEPGDRDVRIKLRCHGGRAADLRRVRDLLGPADHEDFIDTGIDVFGLLQFGRTELIYGFTFCRDSLFGDELAFSLVPFTCGDFRPISPRNLSGLPREEALQSLHHKQLSASSPQTINVWGFFRLISRMTRGWTPPPSLIETLCQRSSAWWEDKPNADVFAKIQTTLTKHHVSAPSVKTAYYFNFSLHSGRHFWECSPRGPLTDLDFETMHALVALLAGLERRAFTQIQEGAFHPTLSFEAGLGHLVSRMDDTLFMLILKLLPQKALGSLASEDIASYLTHADPKVRFLAALCSEQRQRELIRHLPAVFRLNMGVKHLKTWLQTTLKLPLPSGKAWLGRMLACGASIEECLAVWREQSWTLEESWQLVAAHCRSYPEHMRQVVGEIPVEDHPQAHLAKILQLVDTPLQEELVEKACTCLSIPFSCTAEESDALVGNLETFVKPLSPQSAERLYRLTARRLQRPFSKEIALYTCLNADSAIEAVFALRSLGTVLPKAVAVHFSGLLRESPDATLFSLVVNKTEDVDEEIGENLIECLEKLKEPIWCSLEKLRSLPQRLTQRLLPILIKQKISLPINACTAQFWASAMSKPAHLEEARVRGLLSFSCFSPFLISQANRDLSKLIQLMERPLSQEQKEAVCGLVEACTDMYPGEEDYRLFESFIHTLQKFAPHLGVKFQHHKALCAAFECDVDVKRGLQAFTQVTKEWEGNRESLQDLLVMTLSPLLKKNAQDCEAFFLAHKEEFTRFPRSWINLLHARRTWGLFLWMQKELTLPRTLEWDAWKLMMNFGKAGLLARHYGARLESVADTHEILDAFLLLIMEGSKRPADTELPGLIALWEQFAAHVAKHPLTEDKVSRADFEEASTSCFPTPSERQPLIFVQRIMIVPGKEDFWHYSLGKCELALIEALIQGNHPEGKRRLEAFLHSPQLPAVWQAMGSLLATLAEKASAETTLLDTVLTSTKRCCVREVPLDRVIPALLKRGRPLEAAKVWMSCLLTTKLPPWPVVRSLLTALRDARTVEAAEQTVTIFHRVTGHYYQTLSGTPEAQRELFSYGAIAAARTIDPNTAEECQRLFLKGLTYYLDHPTAHLAQALICLGVHIAKVGGDIAFMISWLKTNLKKAHHDIVKREVEAMEQGEAKTLVSQTWKEPEDLRKWIITLSAPGDGSSQSVPLRAVPLSDLRSLQWGPPRAKGGSAPCPQTPQEMPASGDAAKF